MNKVKAFIENSTKLQEMKNMVHEEILLFYFDQDERVHLAWKNKGNEKEVEYDMEILRKFRLSSGYTRFFIVHNHPAGKSSRYHYFSVEDMLLYENIQNSIAGTDIELLDFYVISPKGEFSMKDLKTIF